MNSVTIKLRGKMLTNSVEHTRIRYLGTKAPRPPQVNQVRHDSSEEDAITEDDSDDRDSY